MRVSLLHGTSSYIDHLDRSIHDRNIPQFIGLQNSHSGFLRKIFLANVTDQEVDFHAYIL